MLKTKPYEVLLEKKDLSRNPLITVVISCFKYGREGIEALESLMSQTEKVIDLVLVDDRSPDDSVDVLLEWFAKTPWTDKCANALFVRHLANQGLTQSRNTALSFVVTPYVFILDADNQLYPRALQTLREALETSQYAMAYSLLEKFGVEQGIFNNSVWLPEQFRYANYIDAMALIKIEVLRDFGGYRVMPNKFGWEDYDLWCSFVDRGLRGCHVPQILCRYRMHNSSMVRMVTNAFIAKDSAKVREDFESHHTGEFYFGLKGTLRQREEQLSSLKLTVAARELDVANLRAMLGEREAELDQVKARNSLLSVELAKRTEQLNSVFQSRAWRLTAPLRAVAKLQPRSQREARQMRIDSQLIAQAGIFDVAWYLSQNPDIATHGADPITHYLQHGAFEGRDPSRTFSSQWYLEQNPDVRAAGFNPLVHYLRFGATEGRRPSPAGEAANLKQSLAEAQKEWDKLGHRRLQQLLGSDDRVVFPATESPAVTIILVFYNKVHLSLLCLDSILENAGVPYEVVIVNNCSSDETDRLLERVGGATIINNTANRGFGDAGMQGAEQARGEYLCFLNNDALLQSHALSSALASFREDSKVGVVGGKILLANGDLQEAGSIIWADGSALGYGRVDDPNLPQYEFRRPVDYCSGAFLVTTRSLFRQLGGFSRMFSPAYYEDSDYCMQAWEAGYNVLYEPAAVIRHYESASSDGNEAAKPAMATNQQKFRNKWNDRLLKHLPNSTGNIQRARISASSDTLKILYIEDRIPHRLLGAGFPRSNEILSHLVKQGYRVTCASFTSRPLENEYGDIPREVELLDGVSQRERLFREYVPNSDIVWVSRPHNMAAFLKGRAEKGASSRARVIYDAEAIFAERDWHQAEILGSEVSSTLKTAWLDRELALAKAADAVVVVSERDRETMVSGGVRRVSIIGHQVCANPTAAAFDERRTFLFVGAMHGTDSPNADSMRYFCSSIWPVVRQATGAELIIAGYGADAALSDCQADGVRILGRQDELTSLYNEARVFVVPTRYAAGIPYKAHEAASFGVPLVVSNLIGEQLGWLHGSECLMAGTPIAFASECCRLYQDPDLWTRLRSTALLRVINDLSDQVFDKAVASAMANVRPNGERKPALQIRSSKCP